MESTDILRRLETLLKVDEMDISALNLSKPAAVQRYDFPKKGRGDSVYISQKDQISTSNYPP